MKRTVRETLRRAVEKLFIRVHGNLFHEIYSKNPKGFKLTRLVYDDTNEAHVELVKLCKEKVGCDPIATDQDIFYSIMKVYCDSLEEDK